MRSIFIFGIIIVVSSANVDYAALTPTDDDYARGFLVAAIPIALWWLVSMFFKNDDDVGAK